MATVRSIVNDALLEIGVLSAGETAGATEAAVGLLRFQHQLDSWQAERLTLYTFSRTTYTLPSGTTSRTIGPTGNIVTTANPVFINGINYVVPSSSPAVETPMGRMDDDAYMNLSIKGLSSSLPTQWYFTPGSENGTLTFWPVVSQDVTIAIYCHFGVGVPVDLNDDVIGPPGYAEAFMYQLALRLLTPMGRKVSDVPLLPQMAAEATARMKRPNMEPGLLGIDAALVSTAGGGYNVLSDTTTASSNR